VGAQGATPLQFQWQFQGTNLLGATNANLVLADLQAPEAGVYAVVVSNAYGGTISSNALLTVGPAFALTQPAFVISPTSVSLHGMVTPGSVQAGAWFEWGRDTNYGGVAGAAVLPASTKVLALAGILEQLSPGGSFHYRLVASNVFGLVHGTDQQFTLAGHVAAWGAPTAIPTSLSNVVAITCGDSHDLALRNDGSVAAWGDPGPGQDNVPPPLSQVVAVAAGVNFSVALQQSGTVVAWGDNSFGQTNVPAGLTNAIAIAAGSYHALALKRDGTMVAWGTDVTGQIDIPPGLSNVVAIAAGSYYSLALRDDGTIIAWSDDSAGQTRVPANLRSVVSMAAGAYHGLALQSTGQVAAWGADDAHQAEVPIDLSDIVAIGAKEANSLALRSDGKIFAWGDNSNGQTNVPPNISGAVMLAAGPDHNLALISDSIAVDEALQIELLGTQTRLVWTKGMLQGASEVLGPYNDLTNAVSPYHLERLSSRQFYRLKIE
jgi:hypothetical protein